MKAVRLVQPGLPLQEFDLPTPPVGPADVLVRVKAAGICHSDAHYRAGRSAVHPLPLTLGHEVAGVVEAVGELVQRFQPGDRVCLHYLLTCGECEYCYQGSEQFCSSGKMIGKYADGGYAEYIAVPARSAFHLPEEISFEAGAVMMCSSATSLHALRLAGLKAGQRLAIFGMGGLGFSALQLARALGAGEIYAVDVQPAKLELAERMGAIAVNAAQGDPVQIIQELSGGRGVDVALELIGLPLTMRQAVQSLGIFGRAANAGIADLPLEIATYTELLGKQASITGVADHLGSEILELLAYARAGQLDVEPLINRRVPLQAAPINQVLDELEASSAFIRTVIVP
jgi:propanol-preferring alcohol dehydrogenase